jgi:hypothetical protein
MLRVIVLLIVGIAIGYFLGFGDAQSHDDNIVKRLVSRAGASARGGVNNDIDARLEKQVGR